MRVSFINLIHRPTPNVVWYRVNPNGSRESLGARDGASGTSLMLNASRAISITRYECAGQNIQGVATHEFELQLKGLVLFHRTI